MNTSLVFAELIIIGFEGGIGLAILSATLFGPKKLSRFLSYFEQWELLVVVVLLALTYVLGIIIDRFADSRFRKQEHKLDEEIVGGMPVSIPVMRFSLGTQNDFLNQQLEYTRMRMRIVRASTINSLLIAASTAAYLFFWLPDTSPTLRLKYIAGVLAAGVFFSYACFRAWKSLIRGHLRLAKTMYDHQTRLVKRKKNARKR